MGILKQNIKKSKQLLDTRDTRSGITLIALVITIIVLIILAAVSIALLTGENGILTKATTASENTKESAALEKVKLAVSASINNNGKLDLDQLNDNIGKIEGVTNVDTTTFPAKSTVDGYEFEISDNGEVKKTNGNNGGEESGNLDPDYVENTDVIDSIDGWQLVGDSITTPDYPKRNPEFYTQNNFQTFASNVVGIKIELEEYFGETGINAFDRLVFLDKKREQLKVLFGRVQNEEYIIKGNYYKTIFLSDYANSYRGFSYKVYITTNPDLVKDPLEPLSPYIYDGANDQIIYYNGYNTKKQIYECEIKNPGNPIDIKYYYFYYIKPIDGEKIKDENYINRIQQYKGQNASEIKIYNENNELIYQEEISIVDYYKAFSIEGKLENTGSKIRIEYTQNTDIINGWMTFDVGGKSI